MNLATNISMSKIIDLYYYCQYQIRCLSKLDTRLYTTLYVLSVLKDVTKTLFMEFRSVDTNIVDFVSITLDQGGEPF